MIKLDFSRSKIKLDQILEYKKVIENLDIELEKTAENGMGGWIFLPEEYNKEEYERILRASKNIRENSQVLLVIGIGGSYLGAKAVIDLFKSNLNKLGLEIIFVGQNMSTKYINEVIEYISDKTFSINVISKSGTTTEPAIAFRIFSNILIEKYGLLEARKRIYVTTDEKKGALRKIATEEGYETFVIPENIGGRYSVLSPVGLLPIAAARNRYIKAFKRS